MKKIKKHLTLFLVIALIASSFSATAFADQSENGEHGNQYNYNTDTENNNGYDNSYGSYYGNYLVEEEELYDYEAENIQPAGTYMGFMPFGGIPQVYGIETWPMPPALVIPTTLFSGQIWTGKTVEYNLVSGEPDGTVTIRLYMWGAFYGEQNDSWPLHADSPYLKITDYIGDFWLDTVFQPPSRFPNTIDPSEKHLTWLINQSYFVGTSAPYVVQFTVYLDTRSEPWRTNEWYSTEGAMTEITFQPSETNPYYFTIEERFIAAFDVIRANWNNGTGMKDASIRDNVLDITIIFGENNSTVPNRTAADDCTIPGRWATVEIGGESYEWHLEWSKTPRPANSRLYPYVITVRYFEFPDGTIANLHYELILDGPGGNQSFPGDIVIRSENYFRRHFVENNPDAPFNWEYDPSTSSWRLRQSFDVVAKILLKEPEPLVGTLHVGKMIVGEFADYWDFVSDTFNFTARLGAKTTTSGAASEPSWAVFSEAPGINVFDFIGFSSDDTIESTVFTFSVAHPAEIRGLPAQETFAGAPYFGEYWYYFVDEFFDFNDHNLITVTKHPGIYPDVNLSETILKYNFVDTDKIRVTIKNYFEQGVGYLEVFKLFSGFPGDWGVDNSTIFYIRIWDVEAGNYLLFVELEDESSEFEYHFWSVGNHQRGLSEAHHGNIIMEIPISFNDPIRLANLWTWGAYEVREVRRTGDENDMNDDWENFWNQVVRVAFDDRTPVQQADWDSWQSGWLADWVSNDWELVEEIVCDDAWHATPVDKWYWGVIYSENNAQSILEVGETIRIAVTNRFKFHCGTLIFEKELCDNAEAWGMTPDRLFHAQVLTNEADPRALVFVPHPTGQTEIWRVIGFMGLDSDGIANIAYGYQVLCHAGSPFPPSYAETIIPFSVNTPATLVEVPKSPFGVDIIYTVEEVFLDGDLPGFDDSTSGIKIIGDGFGPSSDGTVHFEHLSERTVIFRNNFYPSTGNFVITKALAGHYASWGVNDETSFFVGVYRDEERIYVYRAGVGVYVYKYYKHVDDFRDVLEDPLVNVVSFRAGQPTVLIGIRTYRLFEPYDIHEYSVVELWNVAGDPLPGRNVTRFVSVVGDIEFDEDEENLFVTITNTFDPSPGVSGGGGGIQPPANGQTEDASSCQAFMIGTPDGLINPRNNITRAEIATVFFRMISDTTRENYWLQENPFADVELHQWFNNAISTTVNMGLFEGVAEYTFMPNQAITRGELAAVLVRFMVYEDHAELSDYDNRFVDIDGHWARNYINIAAGEGWIQGDEGIGGAFRPSDRLTRAEAAAMINRIFGCLVHSHEDLLPNMVSWPDNQNIESWYFLYIKMATNSYLYNRGIPDARYKHLIDVLEPREWSVLERPNSRPQDIR